MYTSQKITFFELEVLCAEPLRGLFGLNGILLSFLLEFFVLTKLRFQPGTIHVGEVSVSRDLL